MVIKTKEYGFSLFVNTRLKVFSEGLLVKTSSQT